MNSMHGYVAANDCDFGGGNWLFAQWPLGSYNALVDLMGHKDLGGKTVLFLVDGLYGAKDQTDAVPFKWQCAPFNHHWSASLLASQDGVAIGDLTGDGDVVLKVSTNLTEWRPWQTNAILGSEVIFPLPLTSDLPTRFFRALRP